MLLTYRADEEHIKKYNTQVLPYALTSMSELAQALSSQGKYVQEEKMHRETLEPGEKFLGNEHPEKLASTANLASMYRNQGRWKEEEGSEIQLSSQNNPASVTCSDKDSNSESCGPSILSLIESSSSRTSTFSNQEQQTATQELESLLYNDEILKSSFDTAIKSQKIEGDRFERNYRRLLKQLGSDLMEEAGNSDQTMAGRFIVSRASRIANGIQTFKSTKDDATLQQMNELRTQLPTEAKRRQTQAFAEEQSTTQGFNPHTDVDTLSIANEGGRDSDDSESEDDVRNNEMPSHHGEMKEFIKRSKAFEYFRARVRRFIYHDQLTWIRSELISKFGSSERHKIKFLVQWNLLEFCETELDGNKDLAQVLTISGFGKKAFATTCEDYINTFWPQNGARVLDALQCAMKNSHQGKMLYKSLNERC